MKNIETNETKLKATLSLFDATAISVGAIVGAGIFVVLGIVAGLAGPALVISVIIAGIISLFSALATAELAAKIPAEGGIYQYAYEMLSPFVGFITGWMWLVANIFAGAAVSLGFGRYFASMLPFFPPKLTGTILSLLLTALNISGVQHSAQLNNILVIIKIVILAFFVFIGFEHINTANLTPFAPHWTGVFYGVYYIFFAFGGFARVAVAAGEVKDPRKNVPRAILLSLLISGVIYILTGFVAVGLVGADRLKVSIAPLSDAIAVTGSVLASQIVSLGALVATATVLLTTILGVSRMAYAMAEKAELPGFLRKVHPKFDTPYCALIIVGILTIVLTLTIDLTSVVAISTFAMLFYYGIANIAALRLKKKDRLYPAFVPILGVISCLVLSAVILFDSPEAWFVGIIVLLAGVGYRLLRRKFLFTKT
jgi:APA family basic amino acid/polyamine antiporter